VPVAISSDGGLVTTETDWAAQLDARDVHVRTAGERACAKSVWFSMEAMSSLRNRYAGREKRSKRYSFHAN
jgi:hypothetical protein